MQKRHLILACLLAPTLSFAAEVLLVSPSGHTSLISKPEEGRWKVGNFVCEMEKVTVIEGRWKIRKEEDKACGRIQMVTNKGAAVQWEFMKGKVQKGGKVVRATQEQRKKYDKQAKTHSWETAESSADWEEMMTLYAELDPARDRELAKKKIEFGEDYTKSNKDQRKIANQDELEFTTDRPTTNYLLTAGFNDLDPGAAIQVVLQPHYAAGFAVNIMNISSDSYRSKLLGALLTVNYYFDDEHFKGYWLQVGAGGYSASTTFSGGQGDQAGLSARVLGGKRWWWKSINLALAGGVQYFRLSASNNVPVNIAGFLPILLGEAGLKF